MTDPTALAEALLPCQCSASWIEKYHDRHVRGCPAAHRAVVAVALRTNAETVARRKALEEAAQWHDRRKALEEAAQWHDRRAEIKRNQAQQKHDEDSADLILYAILHETAARAIRALAAPQTGEEG